MDDIQQQITNKIDQLVDKLKSFRNLSKELEQRLSENKLKVDYLETRQAELEQEVENKKREIDQKNQLIEQATSKIEEVLINIDSDA
jgi:chromosome segregation ATPase|tara:strand:+ start:444 stop:704 length:261 start_codon:yes stop_codon:yes gene_type:complete